MASEDLPTVGVEFGASDDGSFKAIIEQQIAQAASLRTELGKLRTVFNQPPPPPPVPNPKDVDKSRSAFEAFEAAINAYRRNERAQARTGKFLVSELLEVVPAGAEAKRTLQGIADVALETGEALSKIGTAAAGMGVALAAFAALKFAVSKLAEAWANEKKIRDAAIVGTAEALARANNAVRDFGRVATDLKTPLTAGQTAMRGLADSFTADIDKIKTRLEVLKADDASRWAITKLFDIGSKGKEITAALEEIRIKQEALARGQYGIQRLIPGQDREVNRKQSRDAQGAYDAAALGAFASKRDRIEQDYDTKTTAILQAQKDNAVQYGAAQIQLKTAAMERQNGLDEDAQSRWVELQKSRLDLESANADETHRIYNETAQAYIALSQRTVDMTAEAVRNQVAIIQQGEADKLRAIRERVAAEMAATSALAQDYADKLNEQEKPKEGSYAYGKNLKEAGGSTQKADKLTQADASFGAQYDKLFDVGKATGDWETVNKAIDKLRANWMKTRTDIASGWDVIGAKMQDAAVSLGETMSSMFVDMARGTITAGQAMKAMFAAALKQAIMLAAAAAGASAAEGGPTGWMIAIPVAASILAGLTAMLGAERGFDIPSGLNPMVQLHQREMVLPANLADKVRNMTDGGGGASQAAPVTVHFNVSAMDGPSVYRVLREHETQLVRIIQNAQGNRRLGSI
jgi:hypothetical protein